MVQQFIRLSTFRLSTFRLGTLRFNTARSSLTQFGAARFGPARFGPIVLGATVCFLPQLALAQSTLAQSTLAQSTLAQGLPADQRPPNIPAELPEPEHELPQPNLPQVVIDGPILNLEDFQKGICATGNRGRSDRTISPLGATIPSLWWTRDLLVSKTQFNPKLIEGWLVCGAGVQSGDARACSISPDRPGRVEMVVNSQLWTVLDYLSRYELISRFGSAASECGYNIVIFNSDRLLIADYTCDFAAADRRCRLRPDLSGKSGLKRVAPDGFDAIDYRIDFR
jgi:hypothetical protein